MEENMIENKKLKKKMRVLIISLVAMVGLVMVLGTYALWQQTRKQTNRNVLGTACLDLTLENESAALTANAMWPTTDVEGANLTPYTFTVTNNCNQSVNYIVALESLTDDNSQNPSYVANNYVKVKLDGKSSKAFSSLQTIASDTNTGYTIRETRKITSKPLGAGESRTHNLRIWLDENTPMSEINKSFFSKVKIIGGQGIEVDCYEIDNEGTIIAYDETCGKAAVIPASVNGTNVTRISSGAFKGEVIDYTFNGESSYDQNPLSSPYDFWYLKDKRCKDENNTYVACNIEFSIVFSENVIPLYGGEEPTMEQIQALTSDDIYAIIYNADKSEIIEDVLDDYFEEFLGELPLSFTAEDVKYYVEGIDELPDEGTGIMEQFMSLTYDSYDQKWDMNQIGTKTPSGNTKSGLIIDSLDLTQATNLERIDSSAFSNFPYLTTLTNETTSQVSLDPSFGLKKLIYNDLSNISLGCAAFSYAELDSLTLTTEDSFAVSPNQQYDGGPSISTLEDLNSLQDPNDIYCLLGASPFSQSSINHLTINSTNNDTTIDERQFEDFGRIGFLTIGDGVTSIGDYGFGHVWSSGGDPDLSIYGLSLPSSLTTLGTGALRRYRGSTLTIPSGITAIPKWAFQSYNGNSLVIPSSVVSIGDEAFEQYSGNTLTFNEGLQSIGMGAFKYYKSNVMIPYSVTSIGNYAFASLSSYNTVTIKRAQSDVPYSVYTDVWGYYGSLPTFVYDP